MPMQTAPTIDVTVSLDSRLLAENAVSVCKQYIGPNAIHLCQSFSQLLTMFLSYFSSVKHDWDSWNAMSN